MADGDHRIHRLQAGLQGNLYRLALDNAGRRELHRAEAIGFDGAFSVKGLTQGVDHPSDQSLPDRDLYNPASALDDIPFFDML